MPEQPMQYCNINFIFYCNGQMYNLKFITLQKKKKKNYIGMHYILVIKVK